ncbi:MAG TPA: SDR family NAD(P)-dependent oxidoreductase, partial [Solirubrobacteraceae bacterium]|nr:SDR family NAD(P)-dependent oxidoreductase [Solirubrobacteraceae bacterium]
MGTERPIAVVSGAASGIGRATALLLARRGYDVAAADLDLDGAERTAESADHVHAFAVDVAEPSSVHELAGAVRRRLGVPWAVVNCAGWDDIKPFIDT